jgi:aminoglycoside phosphotransferase (APT) family kinase protein
MPTIDTMDPPINRTASADFLLRTSRIGTGRTAEVLDWSPGWVLKLFWEGSPQSYVETEARLANSVHRATAGIREFRAPAAGSLITVGQRIGLLYQRVHGQTLAGAAQGAASVSSLADTGIRLADIHFAIHTVEPESCLGSSAFPEQSAQLRFAIQHAAELDGPLRAAVWRALDKINEPGQEKHCLCHGDFHPMNVLVDIDGAATVIDWVTAEHGSALCDVARTCLRLRFGRVSDTREITPGEAAVRQAIHDAYLSRYVELSATPGTRAVLDQWLPVVAAARLCDGIGASERTALAPLIATLSETNPVD